MLPCARAAIAGGATWLGVAFVDEAVMLRDAGIDVPVLAWLVSPQTDLRPAALRSVDVSVSADWALELAAGVARETGSAIRVHLKADTGLGRAGAMPSQWPALCEQALKLAADGLITIVGVWSHLAYADSPEHPTIAMQKDRFDEALQAAASVGVFPQVRHLANSAATLALPDTHYDLVRPGVAVYGLSPGPQVGAASELGLRPAMRLRADVALAKRVPAGQGVSYAHRYVTDRETTLALVPLGYADGIPRAATNLGPVLIGGRRFTVSGTVCMDQFVVDVADLEVAAGDEVVLFGDIAAGEPTADEWAAAVGTINYEIVTRIGPRVPRVYREEQA
jgi:alanine racemase